MARRRLLSPSTDRPSSAVSSNMQGFLGLPGAGERLSGSTRAKPLSELEVAISTAESRAKSGEWSDARAPVFVGLYAVCHRLVYGVLPLELMERAEFRLASRLALSCMHTHFEDDADALAEFVRWAWKREEGRAKYAKGQGWTDRKRMGYRLLFSAHTVTDYRAGPGAR